MNELIKGIISNPWVGVIGILIGLIGILATVWFALKQRKYPRRISFYSDRIINLYKSFSIPFSKINITYDNKRIDKNIIYVCGYLVCEGERDITNNTEPICINLPEGNKWLDIKVSSPTSSLNKDLSISYSDNLAELYFNKFQREEIIRFQSIIEATNSDITTLDGLTFSHRIDNTDKTIKKKFEALITSPFSMSDKFISLFQIMGVVCLLMTVFLIVTSFYIEYVKSTLYYLTITGFVVSLLSLRIAKRLKKIRKFRFIELQPII